VSLNSTVQLLVCDANIGAFELAKEIQDLTPEKILLETLYSAIPLPTKTDLKGRSLIVKSFPIRESNDIEEGLCVGTKTEVQYEVEPYVKYEGTGDDDLSESILDMDDSVAPTSIASGRKVARSTRVGNSMLNSAEASSEDQTIMMVYDLGIGPSHESSFPNDNAERTKLHDLSVGQEDSVEEQSLISYTADDKEKLYDLSVGQEGVDKDIVSLESFTGDNVGEFVEGKKSSGAPPYR
jgi:hypothetical protein